MRYEMVREIFNSCANNQMRDVFFDEIETDDPILYVRALLEGKEVTLESAMHGDEVVVDVDCAGLRQRYSFSPT